MINNQRLDELYKEWRGNSHVEDSCHPVLSSEEAEDFAQYCTNEETNYLRTQFEEANRKLKAVEYYIDRHLNPLPNEYVPNGRSFAKNLKSVLTTPPEEEVGI